MQKKGKYILFNLAELDGWLSENRFNRVVKLIQNHHTFIPAYWHFKGDNHFQLLEGMERSHLERGFSEIAQNLTTFPDGTVAVCRSIDKIPAGIKGANQAGICIENLGNFNDGADVMTDLHRETIININALLCREFALTPSSKTIIYHHWYDLNSGTRTNGTGVTKSCPGAIFFGGNTVKAAETNFIPLIAEALFSFGAESANATDTPSKAAEVTASRLNVRTGPGTSSPILKTLNAGIKVNVYKEMEGWCKIHPVEQHWVSGRYLRFSRQ